MAKQKRKQKVVAARSLLLDGISKVTIRIRRPLESGDDYECEFEIRGLGDVDIEPVRGVDSLQALFAALESIRRQLLPFRDRLSWMGSEATDGLPSTMLFRDSSNERLLRVIEIAEKQHEAEKAQRAAERTGAAAPAEVRAAYDAAKREADETA
ncbi:MAG TPA: hypothetical protein VGF18_02650 [Candidatus Tumulicola sp.]|jgi:hypothetical protein